MKQTSSPAPYWALCLCFGIMYLAWGTTYLAIQKGVRDEHLPAFFFGGIRIGLAGILILLFQAWRGKTLLPQKRDLAGIVFMSVLLFVGGNGLITMAERSVDSGMAAVLAATTPLWMGLFGLAFPGGERLSVRGWLGLGTGLVGVAVLLSPKIDNLDGLFSDVGPLLVIGSAATWALGSLFLKHRREGIDRLTNAAQQMICGGLIMCMVGVVRDEPAQFPEQITSGAAFAFFYLLIVGSLLGFVAFNWLLGHVSASKVGTYAYVNPAVAVLVGWFAGEAIGPHILGGIGVILLGVFLVREGDKTAPAGDAAAADEAAVVEVVEEEEGVRCAVGSEAG